MHVYILKAGKVTFYLYGPIDEARLARDQRELTRRAAQL